MGFFFGDVLCILYVSVHENTHSAANEKLDKKTRWKNTSINTDLKIRAWVAMDFEWNAITVILDSNFTTV